MTKARNFALHITSTQKEALKQLAEASGMTLTAYIEQILNDAVTDRSLFRIKTERVPASEKQKVMAGLRG
jgi:hypothetical protein